jgi:hypothetical protein
MMMMIILLCLLTQDFPKDRKALNTPFLTIGTKVVERGKSFVFHDSYSVGRLTGNLVSMSLTHLVTLESGKKIDLQANNAADTDHRLLK